MEELQLNNPWTFYYLKKDPTVNYEDQIHKIGKFSTAEGFWQIYSHMIRPEKLSEKVSIQLFRNDSRALWEEGENVHGGSFLVRVQKKYLNVKWEKLVLNLIGEQLAEDINGVVVSTRQRVDFIYVWHKNASDPAVRLAVADALAKVLELPLKNKIDYSPFEPEKSGLDPNVMLQYIVETNGVVEKSMPKPAKVENKEAPTS